MIVLSCKYCNSKNLEPSRFYSEAYCSECNRVLYLWEITFVPISMTIGYFDEDDIPKVGDVSPS